MESLAFIGWVMLIATLATIVYKSVTRKWDIMSYNVMFLLGMCQFYFLTIAIIPLTDAMVTVEGWSPSGEHVYTNTGIALLLFMLFYFLAGVFSKSWNWPGKLVPKLDFPATNTGLTVVVGVVILFVIGTMLVDPGGAYTELVVFMFRPALMSFALGLGVVLVIKNPLNPFFWALGIFLLLLGVLIGTSYTTDRRQVLSVLLVVPWMSYWAWLRYVKPTRQLVIIGAMAFVSLCFLLAYTNIRHLYATEQASVEARAQQLGDLVSSGNSVFASENVKAIFLQDTAMMTMYVVDTYGDQYDLQPFNGLGLFALNPIPRVVWPDKPAALGKDVQAQLGAKGNLSIGVVGHGWVEGHYLGVIGYAIFFGIFVTAVDRMLRQRASSPFFLSAVGCMLGNTMGLPRGETSILFVYVIYGFIFTAGVFYALRVLLRPYLLLGKPLVLEPVAADATDAPPEDDAYAEEGFRTYARAREARADAAATATRALPEAS